MSIGHTRLVFAEQQKQRGVAPVKMSSDLRRGQNVNSNTNEALGYRTPTVRSIAMVPLHIRLTY